MLRSRCKSLLAVGDANARTGCSDGRKSMDQGQPNKAGLAFLEMLKRCGLKILNGNHRGDEFGAFTRSDKIGGNRWAESVIDYLVANWVGKQIVAHLFVDSQPTTCRRSDHQPLDFSIR